MPSAAWTSAGEAVGHRKTHHTETLCLMTLRRKQGTRLSLLTDHPVQRWVRLTQAVAEQVGQSEQPALPLNQKNCKVLSPVHVKDPFLRDLHVTIAPELPPLKLPKGTSTYPPSPKHETKTQTHQCPNPAFWPSGMRENFLLYDLGWVPRTSPVPRLLANVLQSSQRDLRKLSGGDGLKINS